MAAQPPLASKLVAEFIGTFLLVFTVGCNVLGKTPVWTGVSIACVLMVLIYALGGISGANFNPAVSFALALCKTIKGPGKMDWKTCAMYCAVQVLGGLVAAFSYAVLFWNAFHLGPSKGFGTMSAALCEILYTFMLCFVILNVAVARKYTETGNQWYGLAIGFVIVAGAYGAGVVSGGCFNPAVAIGIDTSSAGLGFGWCIFYTLFEIAGATLAVIAFRIVRPEDFDPNDVFDEPLKTPKLVSEFLGTYMLVLTVGLNVLGNSPAGAFSIAASLMCMVYALGDVSGAHFNPAVSVAILMHKMDPEFSPKDAGLYIFAQLLGGIAASFTYTLIYLGNTFPLGPLPGYTWGQVAVAEAFFTFVLCYVVLCTAVIRLTKNPAMFGLAIGSCVTVGRFAVGSVSGGSLNPAVSFGIAASHMIHGGQFYKAIAYSAFEFLGAGAAVGMAMITHSSKNKDDTMGD
jgi:aquaporin Z